MPASNSGEIPNPGTINHRRGKQRAPGQRVRLQVEPNRGAERDPNVRTGVHCVWDARGIPAERAGASNQNRSVEISVDWLATHRQVPFSLIQVSVQRPRRR